MYSISQEEEDFARDLSELFAVMDTEMGERLWGSLANVGWDRGNGEVSMSFRQAGVFINEIVNPDDTGPYGYMNFYCSTFDGVPDPEVCKRLATRGWKAKSYVIR